MASSALADPAAVGALARIEAMVATANAEPWSRGGYQTWQVHVDSARALCGAA